MRTCKVGFTWQCCGFQRLVCPLKSILMIYRDAVMCNRLKKNCSGKQSWATLCLTLLPVHLIVLFRVLRTIEPQQPLHFIEQISDHWSGWWKGRGPALTGLLCPQTRSLQRKAKPAEEEDTVILTLEEESPSTSPENSARLLAFLLASNHLLS